MPLLRSLGEETTHGVFWNFMQQLSQRGVSTLISLLLARFLLPKEFGLMAMMTVFVAVASTLMDSGLKEALIQKRNPTSNDFSTALWANIGLGVLSYGLLFLAAPFVARFYHEPRLTALLRVAGVSVVINSLMVVQVAILSLRLDFKTQLRATVPATIISGGAAIALAYAGAGVWALVAQLLLASALSTGFLWKMRLFKPSLTFHRRAMAELFGFGSRIFATDLLNTVFKNVFVIVIARFFSATLTGYYFFAQKIRDVLISQLVQSIQTVTYPALAKIQDDDQRLKAGYRRVIQVTTFVLFPVMLLIAALAKPLFAVILPATWQPAAVYLQLMCLEALMVPLHAMNLNILKVKGRSDLFLNLALLRKVLIVSFLLLSVRFGIMAVLVAQIVSSLVSYLPNSRYSADLIGYTVREQIADVLPGLLLAALVAGLTLFANEFLTLPAVVKLLGLGIVAVLSYVGSAYALRVNAYQLAAELVRNKMKKVAVE